MKNKKIYLTTREAREMNLPSNEEQIARYNRAISALETPRQMAERSERAYPLYQSVVQDFASRERRYVTLLALAATSNNMEEAAKWQNAAAEMESADSRLCVVPHLNRWVSSLVAVYEAADYVAERDRG